MRKKGEPKTAMSVWVTEETIRKYDELAERASITRSRLVSNVLETVVDDLLAMKKIGLWQFSVIMRDLSHQLKEWVAFCSAEPEHVGIWTDDPYESLPEYAKDRLNKGGGPEDWSDVPEGHRNK